MSSREETVGTLFRSFYEANDLHEIVTTFRAVCAKISIDPDEYSLHFYSSLKEKLRDWRCDPLYDILDTRLSSPIYQSSTSCHDKRLLVVGAGPVGLRTAIEGALLGATVDVIEKRDSFTRNNVVHLWSFVTEDLKGLGVKHFYKKFCSSSIHHISIRTLQCILLKICLMLGVKVHYPVSFEDLIEPPHSDSGWRVLTTPISTPVSAYFYDAIIAADGKQYCLPGFSGKENRKKLAIGITMNFVNRSTSKDILVEELGGVSFQQGLALLQDLAASKGVELENLIYFKDETHYFVMTPTKKCLLAKGVLVEDHSRASDLLSRDNINPSSLETLAKEVAMFATKGGLGELEFAPNYKGNKDVAIFDFTGFMSSDHASRIVERKGKRLLLCIAGDSLFESFWPSGTGMARGFLGAYDAVWMFKGYCEGIDPLVLLKERENNFSSLRSLLKLHSNSSSYNIDPKTRYQFTNSSSSTDHVKHLYDREDEHSLSSISPPSPLSSLSPPSSHSHSSAVAFS